MHTRQRNRHSWHPKNYCPHSANPKRSLLGHFLASRASLEWPNREKTEIRDIAFQISYIIFFARNSVNLTSGRNQATMLWFVPLWEYVINPLSPSGRIGATFWNTSILGTILEPILQCYLYCLRNSSICSCETLVALAVFMLMPYTRIRRFSCNLKYLLDYQGCNSGSIMLKIVVPTSSIQRHHVPLGWCDGQGSNLVLCGAKVAWFSSIFVGMCCTMSPGILSQFTKW